MKIKFKSLLTSITVCLAMGLIGYYLFGKNTSQLLLDNVEALANSEWGGGGDNGHNYEYQKINYEYKTLYNYNGLPVYIANCEVKTCHGNGSFFCNGYINCY